MSGIDFPEKLQCLFRPARYKVLYGGRGGAKPGIGELDGAPEALRFGRAKAVDAEHRRRAHLLHQRLHEAFERDARGGRCARRAGRAHPP